MEVKLDQHFLNNEKILDKIIESSDIIENDTIFEIGVGEGSLTKKILSKNPKKLISVEMDQSLYIDIKNNNFELIYGDGIEEMKYYAYDKLISNIPYSITEPLYTNLLDLKLPFVLLLQGIDFYKNIVERETQWKYFVKAFYNVELICEVSGDEFVPKTKVKSVIVKLKLKTDISKSDLFYQNLWSKRSRIVLNALIYSYVDTYDMSKKDAKKKVMDLDINFELFDKRVDTLSNSEFITIANFLKE